MEAILGWIGLVFLIGFIGWVTQNYKAAQQYAKLKPQLDNLVVREGVLKQQQEAHTAKVEADKQALERAVAEKTAGQPWLADAYADYLRLQDMKEANYLQRKSPSGSCGGSESTRNRGEEAYC